MGNCINRQSQPSPVQYYSDTPSPGSIPDASLHWLALEADLPEADLPEIDLPELVAPREFARIAELPDAALSMVPTFMDVPTLKNLRLSGSAGAALSKNYWVGDADELQTVLDRFNPQGIDGMTLDGQEFTNAHLQMLPPTLKRLKFLNQQMQPQITDAGFAHLSGMRLRQLDLRYFGAMNDACMIHLRDMPIEVLRFSHVNQLTDDGMAHLQAMPLQHFSLPFSDHVTDEGVAKIPTRFLRFLSVQNCRQMTDGALVRLAEAPLHRLELDFCPRLSNAGVRALRTSSVQFLSMSGCELLTPACFDDLYAMPFLKHLSLTHCPNISNDDLREFRIRMARKNPTFMLD